jgi:hypothetical protein
VSDAVTSKKIRKDTVWANGAGNTTITTKSSEAGFVFELTPKSIIYNKATMVKYQLDKFLKEVCPDCKELYGYEVFPPTGMPKVFTPTKMGVTYRLCLKPEMPNAQSIKAAIEIARGAKDVGVFWVLKYGDGRLTPTGVCIATKSQIILQAAEEREIVP